MSESNIFEDSGVTPEVDSGDNNFSSDVIGNKNDTVGGDSLVSLTKEILVSVGGEASQLRTIPSISGAVEEDGYLMFYISVYDVDDGPIASADIDISSISAVLEKSTGGGAFSSAGITQPTFTKEDGGVKCAYRFLAAEWQNGDLYNLEVSGISATIGSDTGYIRKYTWSNEINEDANVEAKIDAIQADIGDPSSRTNLQTIVALLGNPDAAGKSIYDNLGDFVGQTNLQTLKDALAIPDTAGKGLFVELATDRLDNVTFGLSAIKTLIDTVDTVVDALPDSGALTSLAQKSENSSGDLTGTFAYLDAGGEQDVVELTTTTRKKVDGVSLDLVNMTQDGTIRVYHKINGTTYRLMKPTYSFTVASDPDGLYIDLNMSITNDLKITYQEGADEGADRNIPYSLVYDIKE